MVKSTAIRALEPVSNDAAETIAFEEPYTMAVSLEGVAPLLFHRWSCEDVEEKAKARKGSVAKKTDNLESYVWRNELGQICLPTEYVRASIINAAKFKQDPRSPRKSAMDLFKASIICQTTLVPVNGGKETWDYVDQRRMVVQRAAITRKLPAFNSGWTAEMEFTIALPEYVDPPLFREVLTLAGRVIGTAEYRPTYGRFQITNCSVKSLL